MLSAHRWLDSIRVSFFFREPSAGVDSRVHGNDNPVVARGLCFLPTTFSRHPQSLFLACSHLWPMNSWLRGNDSVVRLVLRSLLMLGLNRYL